MTGENKNKNDAPLTYNYKNVCMEVYRKKYKIQWN